MQWAAEPLQQCAGLCSPRARIPGAQIGRARESSFLSSRSWLTLKHAGTVARRLKITGERKVCFARDLSARPQLDWDQTWLGEPPWRNASVRVCPFFSFYFVSAWSSNISFGLLTNLVIWLYAWLNLKVWPTPILLFILIVVKFSSSWMKQTALDPLHACMHKGWFGYVIVTKWSRAHSFEALVHIWVNKRQIFYGWLQALTPYIRPCPSLLSFPHFSKSEDLPILPKMYSELP